MNSLDRAFLRGFRCGSLTVLFGWLAWLLYGIGDVASRIINRCPSADDPVRSSRFVEALMAVYQFTMGRSYRIQKWIEGGVYWSANILPWGPPQTCHEESTFK